MTARFLDSNVILYLIEPGDTRSDTAERVVLAGGTISVQVLNEVLVNAIRKKGLTWDQAGAFLGHVRSRLSIVPLTEAVHDRGRWAAERHRLSVYDGMILGAALEAGCDEVLSEDMQDGLVVDGRLTVRNPFAA